MRQGRYYNGILVHERDIFYSADEHRLLGRRNCTIYMPYRSWKAASEDFFIRCKHRNIEVRVLEWL